MRLSDKTDHDLFFDIGFVVGSLAPQITNVLWGVIEQSVWVSDPDGIYKKVPQWYLTDVATPTGEQEAFRGKYEREFSQKILKVAPQQLKDAGALVFNAHLSFLKQYFQEYELTSVDLWNGAENIEYHFDTINGFDVGVLLYITDEQLWDPAWGGSLRMKRTFPCTGVEPIERVVLPVSGTYVAFNNKNPLVTHKVEPLTTAAVNRYTFTFNYNVK